jgi:hypothetical protein
LGCVFYELLAGRPPFGEKHSAGTDNDFRVKLAHVNEPVPKLATDVPDWLTQLIISMLEKEPDKRPLNCDMVLGKLKAGAKVVEWPPQKSSRKSCETGTTDRHKKLTNFDKPTSSSTTDIALILIIFISIVLYVQINPLQQQDSATTENSAPSFQQAIEKIAKQVENLTKKIEAGNPNNLAPCPKNQIATFLNCWGTFNWQNGDKYVGEWQGGKTNGLGTYSWSNGNRYVGEFKAGSAEGRGTYTLPNGNKYVGEIKDNKKNGLGKFTFPSGNKYIGQFKHDEYNGLGIFTFANAEKYVGEFKDGDFHGRGIKYASNGTIIESGIYAKDKLVKSKFVDPNSFSRIAK